MTISLYINVFKQLLREELIVFRRNFKDQMINFGILVVCIAAVFGYIMPSFGLAQDYGSFQLAGLVASGGLFEVFPSVMMLVSDIEGNRTIDYHLTLPLPSWMVLLKKLTYYALTYFILCLSIVPIGKLVLWNQFDLTKITVLPFLLMTAMTSIFSGTLTLWLASRVENITKIDEIYIRFIFPMWFLGGFQFSWSVLYTVSPVLAYLNLLNPVTYAMEGTRASLLGQEGFFSVWLCIGMLGIFSGLCWWRAFVRLKEQLDFV